MKQTIYDFFFAITEKFSFPVGSELLHGMFILYFYQCLFFIQDLKTSGIHPCNFKFDRKNVSCSNTTNVPQKFLWYISLQKYPTQYTVTQKYRTVNVVFTVWQVLGHFSLMDVQTEEK